MNCHAKRETLFGNSVMYFINARRPQIRVTFILFLFLLNVKSLSTMFVAPAYLAGNKVHFPVPVRPRNTFTRIFNGHSNNDYTLW